MDQRGFGDMVSWSIPIRTVSALNRREHWAKRAKRVKVERLAGYISTPHVPVPCIVTMTRQGPRSLDDDNLRGALKGIRDGIAQRIGLDDADPKIEWRYGQVKARDYAVLIEVECL